MTSAESMKALQKSTTIDTIVDGAIYKLPELDFFTPNIFSSIAFMDELIVKKPRKALLEDFRRLIKGWKSRGNVRPATSEELDISALLDKFPEFRWGQHQYTEQAHFLMIHRLQYDRLKQANAICLPKSRFVFVCRSRFWFFDQIIPVVIQERIDGIPLLEMVEKHSNAIIPKWVKFLPKINLRLRELLTSDLKNHINWFIRNFVYNPQDDILWYIDSKPSCLFARIGNEQNIQGLHDIFFKYD